MLYTTARRVAASVAQGNGYLYTNRDLLEVLYEMEISALHGRGLPIFDSEFTAVQQELRCRQEGTGSAHTTYVPTDQGRDGNDARER